MDINLTTVQPIQHARDVPSITSVLCGTVILLIALTGLIVYLLFITIVLGKKDFKKNSYFTMAGWLGVADSICLVLMITYAAPCIILDKDLSDLKFIGGILNIGWFTGLPLIVFLAVNRYLCFCHKDWYKRYFTIRSTRYLCGVSLMFGTVYSIPSFTEFSPLFFENEKMSWQWDLSGHFGAQGFSIGEVVIVMLVTIVTYCLNILVFKEIHSVNKQTARSGIKHGRDASWERKMFIQFFVTTLWLPVFDIPFISLSYLHNPSPWLGYFVTIAYTLNCSINGWVYIIMNKQVRRKIREMFSGVKSTATKVDETNLTVLHSTPFMERDILQTVNEV